eukprot:TRINITY_DN75488_c0_g1_i1.p1 TRINITY_DN75488_c0_g1~~TRINITY_DN75488_c0_g1_i1.p1  ORF type:complete len:140 (-),score=5.62 TRINITY_DN75488_c0_g1_i1:145-531(-)
MSARSDIESLVRSCWASDPGNEVWRSGVPAADGAVWIRPSGNTVSMAGVAEFSKDLSKCSTEILDVKINHTEGADFAFAVVKTRERFTYAEKHVNDDVATSTVLVGKGNDGKWQFLHGQRSQGQPPAQ